MSRIGTAQASRPTAPAVTSRTTPPTGPGMSDHTEPAATMPSPSRREAHAVTPLLGVEVARAVADAARDRADHPRDAEPQRGRGAQQRGQDNGKDQARSSGPRRACGLQACGPVACACSVRASCGPAAGRPLARRGSRSGRHGPRVKHRSKVGPQARGTWPRRAVCQESAEARRGPGSAADGRPAAAGGPGRRRGSRGAGRAVRRRAAAPSRRRRRPSTIESCTAPGVST